MAYRLRLASSVVAIGLAGAMLAPDTLAQSCDPLVPIQNPSFAGSTNGLPVSGAPWTNTIGASGPGPSAGWAYAGAGVVAETNDYSAAATAITGYNSFQQTLTGGVTRGSIIYFQLEWNNANNTATNGSRAELEVLYNGVVYAVFNTPRLGFPDTDKTAAAGGTATLAVTPAWASLGPLVWADVSVALPAGVPNGGVLQFRSRRNDLTTTTTATDDFRIRTPEVRSPTLCLMKQSNGGTGPFDFTVLNADPDLDTALAEPTLRITTSAAGVPVAYDAWPGNIGAAAGITPMLVLDTGVPVEITETFDPDFVLDGVSCTGGATASVTGYTASVTGVTAAVAPTVCTFTNSLALADLQVSKTAGATTVSTGGTVSYTLTVTNNGQKDAVNALLADTPGSGQGCAVPASTASCTATGGATCPGGGTSGTVAVAALTGSGVTLPSVPVGGQVVVVLQCQVTATGD